MENTLDSFETEYNSSFESLKIEGDNYWWAIDIMNLLGYPNMKSFQKVLDKATKTFVSLNIPHYENILAEMREIDNVLTQDFKLTRFACYIAVMNGDPKKVEVAQAQAYFATQTRKFELYIENSDEIDRILIRDEISDGNKSLASTANKAGVVDFAKFQNAGYLGMYNMMSYQLEKKRGLAKGKLMDNMGRTELAANLFRITQTEERIKNQNLQGQANLESAHYNVGKEVRDIIVKNVGKTPENLPQGKQLPDVKKDLKKGYKQMNLEEKKKRK
ncbi:BRO family protein [Chryseobacterium contaminans]|uniref:BRO family protein n=1 Tax=Chryseobacterium contaminans TaxID=1423959 RepID=UPI003015BD3E